MAAVLRRRRLILILVLGFPTLVLLAIALLLSQDGHLRLAEQRYQKLLPGFIHIGEMSCRH